MKSEQYTERCANDTGNTVASADIPKEYKMKDYKNVIVLRDNDSRDGNIDLIIFTNESTETIESAIDELRERWCENEYDWCLIDEIIEYLTLELDCVVYTHPIDEIWY